MIFRHRSWGEGAGRSIPGGRRRVVEVPRMAYCDADGVLLCMVFVWRMDMIYKYEEKRVIRMLTTIIGKQSHGLDTEALVGASGLRRDVWQY